eukprot:TRINITY_DN110225_c0_g1_i1.p1 TRINITY_DN110225_c0_g1~~TRINITY_DN110225_c0_g1_i1.p1  ORF type:complete len:289 (+),score=52.73 TRINITY_DN110225_c0_g1_i1:46-867(+)
MGAMLGKSIGIVALADIAVQLACFAVAAALQTEKFYDVSASLTYVLCVLLSLRHGRAAAGVRQRVNSGLVIIWATRLGSFLLWRVMKDGGDRRFDRVKTNPRIFFVYWAIQAFWIFVTALPVYTLNGKGSEQAAEKPGQKRDTALCWRDKMGWMLWSLGFVLQVTADVQKSRFKADPQNAGRWIDIGLWRLAQHPNYFGEMCMWWGIFLSCTSELRGLELLSGASPFFVTFLLLRVSGVPLLRKAGLKRWGHLPEYQDYLKRTPLLLPLPSMA